ncbi:unannotated protein [freshwater metagenome]|uniref:Unannotated protein n=1 Tax=freshwater metagenome TaxID=449393 RepID=A0A6J7KRI4_9ZZZZ
MAGIKQLTEVLLTRVHLIEGDVDTAHDGEAALRGIGDCRKGVDGRNFERQVDPAQAGEFGGQHQQIGRITKRRERPVEHEREEEPGDRIGEFVEFEHLIFEREQRAGIDLEGEVEVERATACILGMDIDLPCLTQ